MPKTLQATIEQTGPSSSRGTARSHQVTIDRPVATGGGDKGPLGGEYQLFALGGCFMSNLLAAIRSREAEVSEVQITVTATIDGNPERFTAMTMKVAAKHHDHELMRKLITIAERACVVSNTLRSAVDLSIVYENQQSS